ncbi:MAG: glycosyltransferase [Bacillota bacterium]
MKVQRVAFLNPQGNFDPEDSYWTEHPDFGGQLVYVKELAIAMANQFGIAVDIFTRQIKDDDWPEFSARYASYPESDKVNIIRLPFGGDDFLNKEKLWPYLKDYVREIQNYYDEIGEKPDILTTHYGDGGLAGAMLEAETGIPFTFTAHSLGAQKMDKLNVDRGNLEEMLARYNFHLRIAAERISMNNSATNFVSTSQEKDSQYSHSAYADTVDLDADGDFAVVPPGVNTDIFNPDSGPEDGKIKAKFEKMLKRDIDEERRKLPGVIAASRLDPKKNHIGLIKAFAGNDELQSRTNLVITLRGIDNPFDDYSKASKDEKEILDEMMKIIEENDLKGKVTMFSLNSQQELASIYRILAERKSVFALTAFYEPFGLAPIEAMASGLPVVATENGGPEEIMNADKEHYGILVDPEDPEDIAKGIIEVYLGTEGWEYYHQAGLKRVETTYTWEKTAEGYLDRIRKIIENPEDYGPDKKLRIPDYFYSEKGEAELIIELEKNYFNN